MSDDPPENKGQLKFRSDVVPWLSKKKDQEISKTAENPLGWETEEPTSTSRSSSAIVLGCVTIVALIAASIFALTRSRSDTAAPPANNGPAIFDADYSELARACIQGFLNAEDVPSKLAFIAWPEKVESRMYDFYSRHPDEPAELEEFQFISSSPNFETEYTYYLANTKSGNESIFYVLLAEGDELKIDWECLVAYSPIDLEDFISAPPVEPQPVRVSATLSDYYNYTFSDPEEFQAYELASPGQTPTKIYGYTERNSQLHKQLEELRITGDSQPKPLQLLMSPPSKPGRPHCKIEALIRPDWSGED